MSEKIEHYKCVVIGGSWGGIEAVTTILSGLPRDFPMPIIVVLHQHRNAQGKVSEIFKRQCPLDVKEVDEKESLKSGCVYLAPPNYHLLVEKNQTLSLTIDEHVHFSRPSIDVTFQSAAEVYRTDLIGILLTGANQDGTDGFAYLKRLGGLAIAQDPETARVATMPQSAIDSGQVDYIFDLPAIANFLVDISLGPSRSNGAN